MKNKWPTKKPEAPELAAVTLLKDHTHEGEVMKKGSLIKISPDKTAWLKEQGVIK